MRHATLAPEPVLRAYLGVVGDTIAGIRMRIRQGEMIEMQELHDLMDGIHNIPEMVCAYGGWHVEENIDSDLERYDQRWCQPGSTSLRTRLMAILQRERATLTSDAE